MADTDLKVIGKAKELARHTYVLTTNADRFPKKVRHSLVDKMQIKCLEIFEALFEANRINNKTHLNERCEKITEAITRCDELQFFIELSMDLGYVKDKSAGYWSGLVTDVKRMSIAWRTSERR